MLIRREIAAGKKQAITNPDNAFMEVVEKLRGTSFGADYKAMEHSYGEVVAALKQGESWRFYRSSAILLDELLLNPDQNNKDFVVMTPRLLDDDRYEILTK